MSSKDLSLLRSPRFLPHFVTMFLGAFNDNFCKSAVVMLITYRYAETTSVDARILVTIASGVLILPFLLFSSIAAEIADCRERSRLMRCAKIAEAAIMLASGAAFALGNVWLMIAVVFAMGTQSAFYGPLKYSAIPQLVDGEKLLAANGLVEMGTFLAILAGTAAGGVCALAPGGTAIVCSLAVIAALAGYAASRRVPLLEAPRSGGAIRSRAIIGTLGVVRESAATSGVFSAIIGASWFYFVGAIYLAQFPVYAMIDLGADESAATLFMTVFSLGIGAGSLACERALGGRVTAKIAPPSLAAVAAFGAMLFFITPEQSTGELIGALELVSTARGAAIVALLFMMSFAGGLYVVPLYAVIQKKSGREKLATVTACVNIMDSIFMVASALGASALLALGASTPQLFLAVSILTFVAASLLAISIKKGGGIA